jgi:hypothetical protein
MPIPWKPDYNAYGGSIGATVDTLKEFIGKLFDPGKYPGFRDQFFDDPSQPGYPAGSTLNEPIIRRMLKQQGINIPETHTVGGQKHDIRIVIVDVQNARLASYETDPKLFGRKEIDKNDWFYLLVMPPVPSIPAEVDLQTYESAWYHAIVDGYGM